MLKIFSRSCFAIALLALGLACSTKIKELDTDEGTLREGDRLMKSKFYEEAREQYYRIKTEFPDSELQVKADLKIADSFFKEKSYKPAAESYENFVKTYPGRPEVPYAIYRMGDSYFRQMPGNYSRDSTVTEKAVDSFTRLIIDFPESEYTPQALEKIDEANDSLAKKVFGIARFYERTGKWAPAARRYAQVMDLFADHPLAEESFARRIRALRRAGEEEDSLSLQQEFKKQYPNSKFKKYLKAGE